MAKVYGFCDAGCRRRVPQYEEFLASAYKAKMPLESGYYYINVGETIICKNANTTSGWGFNIEVKYGDSTWTGYSPSVANADYDEYAEGLKIRYLDAKTGDYGEVVAYVEINGKRKFLGGYDISGNIDYSLLQVRIGPLTECYHINEDAKILVEGASAYEVAVANGFEGTEQEWLDSLKGEDGKDGEKGENGVSCDITREEFDKVKKELAQTSIQTEINRKKVTNIEESLSDDAFVTDKTSAYIKVVPSGALPYAEVKQVGGMTYKTDEGLRDTKVTELVSEGANLISRFSQYGEPGTEKNISAVTLIVEKGNSVSLSGKATALAHFVPTYFYLKAGTYTFSAYCTSATSETTIQAFLSNRNSEALASNVYLGASTSKTFTVVNDGEILVNIYAYANASLNHTFYFMVNRGETAEPYKPYRAEGVDTFPISAELRAFLEDKGYGGGVSGYPNYIDFERKVFVQNTYRVVLDGVTYGKKVTNVSTANGYYYASLNLPYSAVYESDLYTQGICSHFTMKRGAKLGHCYIAAEDMKGFLMYNTDQTLTTVDAWNAWVKEQYDSGNPLTVEYALAEPIEIDISQYLTDDNFIAVEGGGVIKAVNEYEYDAPSVIEYQKEIAE